MLME
jgi:beta-1,2-xylosyltransferase